MLAPILYKEFCARTAISKASWLQSILVDLVFYGMEKKLARCRCTASPYSSSYCALELGHAYSFLFKGLDHHFFIFAFAFS